MSWLRLFLVLGDLLNRVLDEIRRRKYIHEGREKARQQAQAEQARQIEKAQKARQRVKDEDNETAENNSPDSAGAPNRMRRTDPYQRD